MTSVNVRLFGAFRQLHAGESSVKLEVSQDATVRDVKNALAQMFQNEPLVNASALADDRKILSVEEALGTRTNLAILPPVCGG